MLSIMRVGRIPCLYPIHQEIRQPAIAQTILGSQVVAKLAAAPSGSTPAAEVYGVAGMFPLLFPTYPDPASLSVIFPN